MQKKTTNIFLCILISIILVLCLSLSACAFNKESQLIGSWVPAGAYDPEDFPLNMNLYEGGSAIIDSYNGNYYVDDNSLSISVSAGIFASGDHSYLYEIDKGTLYLSAYGNKVKYINLDGDDEQISAYYFAKSVKEGDGIEEFLKGKWLGAQITIRGSSTTISNGYHFDLEENEDSWHISYDLPSPAHEDESGYSFKDNVIYFNDGSSPGFRFEPVDEDNINVYCFDDDLYYEMHRTSED